MGMQFQENKNNIFDQTITNLKSVKRDMTDWQNELFNTNTFSKISKLHNQNTTWGTALFILDWLVILTCFIVTLKLPIILPIAILISGSRIRALSNLIHDSSHLNLNMNKMLNDLITNMLAGYPLFSPVQEYRVKHLMHHRHLGHDELDPDVIMHKKYSYDDRNPPYKSGIKNILFLIFNYKSWVDSSIGSWKEIDLKYKLFGLMWWAIVISIASIVAYPNSILFLFFFIIVRMTGYHAVRIYAEFIDHSGLNSTDGDIVSNTRIINNPNALMRYIFHPHNDVYHALHHFDPRIPCHSLGLAHILVRDKITVYKNIKLNNGYFFGHQSALSDLGKK